MQDSVNRRARRLTHETAITAEQFETLWRATVGSRIEKTRYTSTLPDGLIVEMDIFRGGSPR